MNVFLPIYVFYYAATQSDSTTYEHVTDNKPTNRMPRPPKKHPRRGACIKIAGKADHAPRTIYISLEKERFFQVPFIELLNCLDRRRRHTCCSGTDIYYCIKGYAVFLVGFVIDQLFVEAVKNEAGSLRPNFIDVCRPEYNKTLCKER